MSANAVGGREEAEFMDNGWAFVGVVIIIAAAIVAFAAEAGRRRTRAASATDKAVAENWPASLPRVHDLGWPQLLSRLPPAAR
jgi:hypothetical protein